MTKIIGFAGGAQVGKDTVANFAERFLDLRLLSYDRRAFADQLKQYCVDVLGLNPKELWGTDEDKNKFTKYEWDKLPISIRIRHQQYKFLRWIKPRSGLMTNRDILNIVGTDIHRHYFGDNIWIDALFNKDFSQKNCLIITDIRTLEEVEAVQKRGGIIVKLLRNNKRPIEHEIQKRLLDWQGYDYCYQNDGTLKELQKFIGEVLKHEIKHVI